MKKADLILKNGHVYSMTLDGKRISGEAVAVKDGLIAGIGSDEEMASLATDDTKVIDCAGNTILPGLCDVHCHPSMAKTSEVGCNLFGIYRQPEESARSITDQYLARLKEYVANDDGDGLIRGTGWVISNYTSDDEMPTRHDIDSVCSDRPVILESFCQHNIWVNSKAIELAGVNADTPEPKIGRIHREDNGYPKGIFNDPEAMDLIKLNVPGYDLSVEQYKEDLLWYQKECANRYGVTMVQDCMHSDNAREAYRQLAEEGKLTVYARAVYHLKPDKYEHQMEEFISRKGTDNVGNDFRIDTVKMFAEGAFAMIDGYSKEFCDELGVPKQSKTNLYIYPGGFATRVWF